MIVRILNAGQWEVPNEAVTGLNEIDDQIERAVRSEDAAALALALTALHDRVRTTGKPVPDAELVDSDLILPSTDASLAEVEAMLSDSDEGLIPG
ncbi:MAG: hypothetical protein JWP61_2706 [Friedmanniella sp.]|nr:hypothetical protein [Friedmanniella sp.]